MDIAELIVGSSTPDGLAPLTQSGVVIFAVVLSLVPLLWAIANLLMLVRPW